MVTEHREVENKYDVALDATLPELGHLPGVTVVAAAAEHDLEATYFDTAELDLARAGITLRRRTGGDDAGWHLKLPGSGARREIRVPLGRSTTMVPERLRTVVMGYSRGRPLSAVATIRTHRTLHRLLDGQARVIAEVADDRVTGSDSNQASVKTWREWEVELVDGDADLLEDAGALLRSTGAESSPWSSKLARTLDGRLGQVAAPAAPPARRKDPAKAVILARISDQVERLRSSDPLVRLDAPEGLHDIRVAIRRLRAALATYRPCLDSAVTDPLRAELKWLGGELSPARDAQMLRARLHAKLAKEPPMMVRGDAPSRLAREADDEYRRARARALRALESERYLSLLEKLLHLTTEPPWSELADQAIDDVLRARVRHDWERLQKRVSRLEQADDEPERDRLLHDVRKAAKRVRYATEPLVPIYGKSAKALVKATKRVQSALGEHHDSVVSREWLRRLADASGDGSSSFTFGILHAREEAAAAKERARYGEAWKKANRTKSRKLVD